MNRQAIQSMWVKGRVSTMARLSMASFLANGHEFHLYSYGPIEGAPPGVKLMDAREVLSDARLIRQQTGFAKGSYAPFADLFRYELLWQRGGWWSDADMVCLRPWDLEQPRVVATRWEPGDVADPINCVLRFPPGDPVMRHCLDVCTNVDLASARYGAIGPILVAEAVAATGSEAALVPWTAFCPVGYRQTEAFVCGPAKLALRRLVQVVRRRPPIEIGPEAFGVHLWHEMWRHYRYDPDGTHHPASWYEAWKRHYLAPLDDRANARPRR